MVNKGLKEDLVNKLKQLGLTTYEAKAYLALVLRGTATASEICDISGIPYTRIYDVLASLENKGMAVTIPGRPLKFRAIDPRTVLENIRNRIIDDYSRRIKEVEMNVKDLLGQLVPIYERRTSDVRESISMIRGRKTISDTIISLIKSYHEYLALMLTHNTFLRLLRNKPRFKKLLVARHGSGKPVIVVPTATLQEIPSSISSSVEVRGDDDIPINIVISDEKILVYESIPDDLSPESTYDTGFLIRNEAFSRYLYRRITRCR